MEEKPLRILHLEDSDEDAEPVQTVLEYHMCSGTIDGTFATECLEMGATICAPKHQLALLPSIVRNALGKSRRIPGEENFLTTDAHRCTQTIPSALSVFFSVISVSTW